MSAEQPAADPSGGPRPAAERLDDIRVNGLPEVGPRPQRNSPTAEELLADSGPTRRNLVTAYVSLAVVLTLYQLMARLWWITVPLLAVGVWRAVLTHRTLRSDGDPNDAHKLVRSIFYLPTVIGLVPVLVAMAAIEAQ